jgi:hypothetical protein
MVLARNGYGYGAKNAGKSTKRRWSLSHGYGVRDERLWC